MGNLSHLQIFLMLCWPLYAIAFLLIIGYIGTIGVPERGPIPRKYWPNNQ